MDVNSTYKNKNNLLDNMQILTYKFDILNSTYKNNFNPFKFLSVQNIEQVFGDSTMVIYDILKHREKYWQIRLMTYFIISVRIILGNLYQVIILELEVPDWISADIINILCSCRVNSN